MRVLDYSLIESDDRDEFVLAVAKACREDGWFPSGGICVTVEPGALISLVYYAQALVKYGP